MLRLSSPLMDSRMIRSEDPEMVCSDQVEPLYLCTLSAMLQPNATPRSSPLSVAYETAVMPVPDTRSHTSQ